MLHTLVVNDRSGGGLAPDQIVTLLGRNGVRVEVLALSDLDRPLPDGTTRLVVAGGDGTIAAAAVAARAADVVLAVVPTGTANDFARAVGLPLDIDRACALAADPTARTRRYEIATFDGRPFVNAAAAGLSARASEHAEPLKPKLGALAYPVAALRAGLAAPVLPCRVWCDGVQRFEGDVWQVVVAATGAFGGGSAIGNTRPDDGELDVAVVPSGPRVALARRAWGMRRGRLTEQADVPHHRGSIVDVEVPEGTQFNVDGDLQKGGSPTRFAVLPGGVEVVTN